MAIMYTSAYIFIRIKVSQKHAVKNVLHEEKP